MGEITQLRFSFFQYVSSRFVSNETREKLKSRSVGEKEFAVRKRGGEEVSKYHGITSGT